MEGAWNGPAYITPQRRPADPRCQRDVGHRRSPRPRALAIVPTRPRSPLLFKSSLPEIHTPNPFLDCFSPDDALRATWSPIVPSLALTLL